MDNTTTTAAKVAAARRPRVGFTSGTGSSAASLSFTEVETVPNTAVTP